MTLAEQVFIGVSADLSVSGIPLPRDARGAVISDSAAAANLKQRLLSRVSRYVDGLGFGEPVRYSEVMWALMNEPGISDVQNLRLLRFPPDFPAQGPEAIPVGENVRIQPNEIATMADDDTRLRIV